MSAVAIPLPLEEDEGRSALREYRRHRRAMRIAGVDKFDAFYKAYLTALVGGLIIYGSAGLLGDAAVTPEQLASIESRGSAFLGLVVVLSAVVALRSGVRGGPLAFEPAEVRHILMAPVDRRDSMRTPARSHLRHSAFLGLVVGAAAGLVALRRLPGAPAEWVAAAAFFGLLTGVLASAAAMIVAGLRMPRWAGDLVAIPLVAWAVADVFIDASISPFSWLGSAALFPLTFSWELAAGTALVIVAVLAALSLVSRGSIESAERRSRLVGQLRFAATVQDVRTVMVLQRQMAQEHPRNRPIIRLGGARRTENRKGFPAAAVMVRRCMHNYMRWPLFRYVRLLVLTGLFSASVVGAWVVSTALVVPAGLLLWLMAIDLVEALAQEADHPSRLKSQPRVPGWTQLRLLLLPAWVLVLLACIAGIPAIMWGPPELVSALFLPIVTSASVLALGAAALVVTRSGVNANSGPQTAEVTGFLTLWHAGLPPFLAVAGLVPLVVARTSYLENGSVELMLQEMNIWWYGVLAIGSWGIAWVRYGGEIRHNIATAQNAPASESKSNSAPKSTSTAGTSTSKKPSAPKSNKSKKKKGKK